MSKKLYSANTTRDKSLSKLKRTTLNNAFISCVAVLAAFLKEADSPIELYHGDKVRKNPLSNAAVLREMHA